MAPERSSKWYIPEEYVVRPLLDIQTEELAATFAADDAAARSAAIATAADTATTAAVICAPVSEPRAAAAGIPMSTAAAMGAGPEANVECAPDATALRKQRLSRRSGGSSGPPSESRVHSAQSTAAGSEGHLMCGPPSHGQARRTRRRDSNRNEIGSIGGRVGASQTGVRLKGEDGGDGAETGPSQPPKRRQRPQKARVPQDVPTSDRPTASTVSRRAEIAALSGGPDTPDSAMPKHRSRARARARVGASHEGKTVPGAAALRAEAPEYLQPAAHLIDV